MTFRPRRRSLRPSRRPGGPRTGPGLGRWTTRLALAAVVAVVVLRLFIGTGPAAPSEVLDGRVTHVRDGDTIEVSGVAVRLATLDCPELGTPEGEAAAARMRRAARFQRVTCTLTGQTSHDRVIGTCVTRTGTDLAERLIKDGDCRPFRPQH